MADRQRFPAQETKNESRFQPKMPIEMKIKHEDGTEIIIRGTISKVISDTQVEINTHLGPIKTNISDCILLN